MNYIDVRELALKPVKRREIAEMIQKKSFNFSASLV